MARPEQPSDPAPSIGRISTGEFGYSDEGSGPVIVAIHGLPGSIRDFRWLAPALAPHFRVVRLDLPGFGATPFSTWPSYAPEARAAFVLDAIRALQLDAPILLGHSMGAVICTVAAQLAPVRGVVLVSSPGLVPHRGLRRIPRRTMSFALNGPRRARLVRPLLRHFFKAFGFRGPYPDSALVHTIHGVAAMDIRGHARRLRSLTRPTAVIWCDDDPLIEPEIAAALANAVPDGPRLHFADGGHNPQKAHATEIADALRDWSEATLAAASAR